MGLAVMDLPAGTIDKGKYLLIDVKRIRRFAGQPRIYFDPKAMKDLERSIDTIGQRKPVEVRRITNDQRYDWELVDGERRWICHKNLGKPKIKAVIQDSEDEEEQYLDSLAANIPGRSHTPLEIAYAIDKIRTFKKMQGVPMVELMERIAALFGRDTVWAYTHLKLLNLSKEVQSLMDESRPDDERLNVSSATLISKYSNPDFQFKLAVKAVSDGMSRRQLEIYADNLAARTGKGEMREGVRKKEPRDNYRNFLRFFQRLHEGAHLILGMPVEARNTMILSRDARDRKMMLKDVQKCITDLQEIAKFIEKAKGI